MSSKRPLSVRYPSASGDQPVGAPLPSAAAEAVPAPVAPSEPVPSRPPPRRPGRRRTQRLRLLVWVLPALTMTTLFLIVPTVMVALLSVRPGRSFEVGTIYGGFSLEHYAAILTSPGTLQTFTTTLLYVAGTVVPSVLLGVWVALMVDRAFRGRAIAQALLLLPWAVPGVVVSVGFMWMLNESFGVVNAGLVDSGVINERIGWLTDVKWAMTGVLMPTVWKMFPFVAITLIAALKSIPDDLYEAAAVDGASEWQVLRNITLPAVRAALALVIVMTSLLAFKEFDFIYPLTQGGPADATETLSIRVYNEAFQFFRLERAAAWGIATLLVGAGAVAGGLRWLRDEYF